MPDDRLARVHVRLHVPLAFAVMSGEHLLVRFPRKLLGSFPVPTPYSVSATYCRHASPVPFLSIASIFTTALSYPSQECHIQKNYIIYLIGIVVK